MRVLVVEDQAAIAMMLADELTEFGHEVIGPASTSHEAIRLAELHRPASAFVDLDLEEKAIGLDVARHLAAKLGVSVVICTGQPALARQSQTGAIGLISKPYIPKDAVSSLSIVEAVLEGTSPLPPLPASFELLVGPP